VKKDITLPGSGVGRSHRARRGGDVSAKDGFEVGRSPVWQWLVHGGTGGSKQLTTEGKVADQARPNGRRPADIVPRKERLHPGSVERRCADSNKVSFGLVDPQTNDNCVCLHESSGTAVSLETFVLPRGITHPRSGRYVNWRWERPIPIPDSANKTLKSYWCLYRVLGGDPPPSTHPFLSGARASLHRKHMFSGVRIRNNWFNLLQSRALSCGVVASGRV